MSHRLSVWQATACRSTPDQHERHPWVPATLANPRIRWVHARSQRLVTVQLPLAITYEHRTSMDSNGPTLTLPES